MCFGRSAVPHPRIDSEAVRGYWQGTRRPLYHVLAVLDALFGIKQHVLRSSHRRPRVLTINSPPPFTAIS